MGQSAHSKSRDREVYEPPRLVVIGTLLDLTRGAVSSLHTDAMAAGGGSV